MRMSKLEPFKEIAICPHAPDDKCECRKPSGQMILDLIQKYHLDPNHSYMVGDKLIDAEAGKNAGVQGIIVRNTQYGDYPYFKNLLEFAQSLKK